MDGGLIQTALGYDAQLLLVGCYAAAGAAQSESGTDDDRVAYLGGYLQSAVQIFRRGGGYDGLTHLLKGAAEEFPVLGPVYGLNVRTQQPHAEAVQSAVPAQLHGYGETGLAPQPRQNGVRPLFLNDAGHGLCGKRFQIYLVRQMLVGHYSGGVGVYKNGADALLAQYPAGLGPGVVELRRLTYDDGAGADDQYLVYALVLRHCPYLPSWI